MLLVAFPSLHVDVVCGILHLCTQSLRRLFLGAQVFSNDDKHTARCAMAVGTQRCYWFGKTRLKLELGFCVATTLKQYVGDQQLKLWCIQNVSSLQKHENLAFCWFLTSFSAAARASGASRWPPQQTRTVLYSRDTVRVYIRYAYIYAVFSNPASLAFHSEVCLPVLWHTAPQSQTFTSHCHSLRHENRGGEVTTVCNTHISLLTRSYCSAVEPANPGKVARPASQYVSCGFNFDRGSLIAVFHLPPLLTVYKGRSSIPRT